jgi:hypothetical protein
VIDEKFLLVPKLPVIDKKFLSVVPQLSVIDEKFLSVPQLPVIDDKFLSGFELDTGIGSATLRGLPANGVVSVTQRNPGSAHREP